VHHIIIKPKIWCGMSFPVGHIIYNLISPGHSSLLIVLHIGFCQKKILIFSTRIIHTYDVLFLKTTHLAVAVGQSAAEHCATRAHCCRVVEAAPTLRQPLYARVQRATRRPYRPEDIFRLRSAVRPPSDASTAARSPPRPLFDDVARAASLAFPCSSPPPSPHRFSPPRPRPPPPPA
jgi:hypothetical protein